jgi:hypothetical protein
MFHSTLKCATLRSEVLSALSSMWTFTVLSIVKGTSVNWRLWCCV